MAAEESGLLSQLHPRQRVDPKLEEGKAEMEKMDDHLEDEEEKLQEEEEELKNLNAAAAAASEVRSSSSASVSRTTSTKD